MEESKETPANIVPFSEVCSLLDNLFSNKKHKQEQCKILNHFMNDFRLKTAGKKNSSIFPILRLLLPKEDRERSAYNLKQAKLSLLLINTLSLNKQSQDAKQLTKFQSVSNVSESDLPGVAYFVLKNRIGNKTGTLSVGKINELLDKMASAEVGNKGPILEEAMSYAIRNLSGEQMKWFLRIILKDLKLGIGHHKMLASFHPDAPELYDNCRNLMKVCEDLEDGEARPPEAGVQMFFAICPMLSERLDVTDIEKLPREKTYQTETKFDGERFQMHMENGVFEYYSRKGFAWSDTYGKTFDSGLLTPHLKECFRPSVTSFILDGEMMGWHKYYQCLGSKGMAFDVKKITENSKFRPCFCVFDVLYYNGKSLVGTPDKGGLPLKKRLEILDTMFREITGVIHLSKRKIVGDRMEILEALNKAIDDQDEGIVVKDLDSYYIANRRNAGWYKIKPEYTENAMNDLDFVIIGADEAENKRQGRAKSFLLACADRVNPDAAPHRWVCVGRVAIGLTYDERARVCALLEQHWTRSSVTSPPRELCFNKEKPDYWILPQHSIAVEVRATELIRSNHFGTDYTLRFPRIIKIRDDKPVNDVMTLDAFNNLVSSRNPVNKLSTKRISESQISDVASKVPKKRTTVVKKVADQFRPKAAGDVQVTSNALKGRKICIYSDDEDCSKSELIQIVESHGGKSVANIGPDTWCCVVGKLTPRVRNLTTQDVNIVSTTWLRSLPASDTPCKLAPLDMMAIKKSTKLALSVEYDKFGDSYTEEVDEATLRKCFQKMESEEPEIYLTNDEMLQLDKELFGDNNPFSFLRPCFIHFLKENTLLELEAKLYGANVCDMHSPRLTHVVYSEEMEPEIQEYYNTDGKVMVLSDKWLKECIAMEKLVSETNFLKCN